MAQMKSWVDAHKDEQFGDNRHADIFRLCQTCSWRNKVEDGYMKFTCDVFGRDDPKPLSIMYNGECDFYKKE